MQSLNDYGQAGSCQDVFNSDCSLVAHHAGPCLRRMPIQEDSDTMLQRIRASLQARLEGRNEGGDSEVMRLVDEIVAKEIEQYRIRAGY